MKVAFGLLAGMLAGVPALAQSPQDVMFPNAVGCYTRTYDAEHLGQHPGQNVTQIAVRAAGEIEEQGKIYLGLALQIRTAQGQFSGEAYCENTAGDLSCQMKGDGGWFTLTLAKNDAIRLDVGRGGLVFEGAADFLEVSGTKGDDRQFLMVPGMCF